MNNNAQDRERERERGIERSPSRLSVNQAWEIRKDSNNELSFERDNNPYNCRRLISQNSHYTSLSSATRRYKIHFIPHQYTPGIHTHTHNIGAIKAGKLRKCPRERQCRRYNSCAENNTKEFIKTEHIRRRRLFISQRRVQRKRERDK